MVNLFEYQNKVTYTGEIDALEAFLDDVWSKREVNNYFESEEAVKSEVQRFIQIFSSTHQIKSNKYVGVIHFNGNKINLLPKIFYNPNRNYSEGQIYSIQKHILWYLSYCRKIRFPNYQCSLGHISSDFFEIFIYLFAKYTKEILSGTIYQQYIEVNCELPFIKGKLNTQRYISENIATGKWYKLNCDFESFSMDNKFNRIVKYVCQLLLNVTKNEESLKFLREILFILEDVTDVRASANDCKRIIFNPIFADLETIRDYCTLFLSNSVSLDYKNDLKLFAFLIPMEYLFEDFIFGFISKNLPQLSASSQSRCVYLDEDRIFNLKPDLCISSSTHHFLADTKYKFIYSDSFNPKKGVSQNDLYQMISYAIRFKIETVILFYPSTIDNFNQDQGCFKIHDEIANGYLIRIYIYQLPIINYSLFENESPTIRIETLEDTFIDLSRNLKTKLSVIFTNEPSLASN